MWAFSLAYKASRFFFLTSLSPLSNLNSFTVIFNFSLALSMNSATGVAYLFYLFCLGSWSSWSASFYSSSLTLKMLTVLRGGKSTIW